MPTATQTRRPDLDELTDAQLLKRYADHRDERSFSLLFDRWNSKLHRFIHSKIGDWDTAEELTLHTWERAFRHAHRFQWDKRFSTWIYTIAHNLAKNELRNRSRTPITLYQRIREKWDIDEGEDRGLEWGDRAYAPDKEAQKRELEDLVKKATAELKPQHRVVFVLREFEGKDYEAISEITGAKLGTIKSRLSRARQHFRDALLEVGLAAADLDQLELPAVEVPPDETPPDDEPVDMDVNLNTASERELCRLPDVGPTVAQRIIEARPFESVEELADRIDWLNDGRVEAIRPRVNLSRADLEPSDESVDMEPAMPLKTVQWRKGYNGLSAVHAVRSADEEGVELSLACGAELSVQEREGVELNPEPEATCQRCQWALVGR